MRIFVSIIGTGMFHEKARTSPAVAGPIPGRERRVS